ncbi:hypothetical protein [Planctomyces sp. SH-PL62]|uniref:hypothetical protein n=1 Tax=Planctomyces sp. SH-PL62 TaxID=1636152 RepID=UPI00078D97F0|nr:hypothetical protein [Planctomyces sp. SH-PL62]AMV37891.1 hypothetical protein VT85_10665 [Planctomyces sp. SH-PL62]
MKWTPAWLVLIAALTGTPLRQSEAWGDFTRSLVESSPAAVLEAPDGGVGDDADLGVPVDSPADPDGTAAPDFHPFHLRPPFEGPTRLRESIGPPPEPPPRRRSRLQVFLF